MPCGQSRETRKRSELAGWAAYGYCASHSCYFWGLRLYLLCAPDGMPISFCLAPANDPEREVTSVDTFALTQFGKLNGFEWYFAAGRPNLDFLYGRDSSALVAEHLALDPGHEGPLVLTQNARVDVPVIAIGGSNGLTPEPRSFAGYLASIATPPEQTEVHVLEGYAHLDVVSAEENEAVPLIADFIRRLLRSPRQASH